MLNPVHLRTLGVVLTTGSFADAARQLGYAPSAVSQQMSALERHLRLTLFEREAHAIRPTAAAAAVAERALPALGALRRLDEDLLLLAQGTIGLFRVGSFPTASHRLLPAALSTLRHRRPGVDVELDEAEPYTLIRSLEAGDLDVALVYTYGTVAPHWAHGHVLDAILDEDLVLLRRPAKPGDARVLPPVSSLADFAGSTWVATRPGTQGAAALGRLCRDGGFEPAIRYRSNNYGVLQGLVAAGMGVGLVPALGLDDDSAVAVQKVAHPEAHRTVSATFSPTVPPDLAEVFTDALRRAASLLLGEFVRLGSDR